MLRESDYTNVSTLRNQNWYVSMFFFSTIINISIRLKYFKRKDFFETMHTS